MTSVQDEELVSFPALRAAPPSSPAPCILPLSARHRYIIILVRTVFTCSWLCKCYSQMGQVNYQIYFFLSGIILWVFFFKFVTLLVFYVFLSKSTLNFPWCTFSLHIFKYLEYAIDDFFFLRNLSVRSRPTPV